MRRSDARTLLISGQACISYRAALFSRDPDLLTECVRAGLRDPEAEPISAPLSLPTLDPDLQKKKHACHFRRHRPGIAATRLAVQAALKRTTGDIIAALQEDQNDARRRDGKPLKRELEPLRHQLRRERK